MSNHARFFHLVRTPCDGLNLVLAQRLAAVELSRLSGMKDLSIEEFEKNMLKAIDRGAKQNK